MKSQWFFLAIGSLALSIYILSILNTLLTGEQAFLLYFAIIVQWSIYRKCIDMLLSVKQVKPKEDKDKPKS